MKSISLGVMSKSGGSVEKREFKLRYGSVSIEPLIPIIQCPSDSKSIKIEFESGEQVPDYAENLLITVQAKRQHGAGYYLHLTASFKSQSNANFLVRINKDFVAGLNWDADEVEALCNEYFDTCMKNIYLSSYGGELCFYSRQGNYIDYKPIADISAVQGILKLIQTDISQKPDEELAAYFGYLNSK